MTREEKTIEAARVFMQFCNSANRQDMELFAKEVTSNHRTIQQAAFGVMMKCVEFWAKAKREGHFDARNKMTVIASDHITIHLDMDACPDAPLFLCGDCLGLPYI